MAAIPGKSGSINAPGGDGPKIRNMVPLNEIDRIHGWEPGGPGDPNVWVTNKCRTRQWRAVNPRCTCVVPFDTSTYSERMALAHKLCPRYGELWRKNGRCRTNPKLPGYENDPTPPPRRPKKPRNQKAKEETPPTQDAADNPATALASAPPPPVARDAQRDPSSSLFIEQPTEARTLNLPGCSYVARPPGPQMDKPTSPPTQDADDDPATVPREVPQPPPGRPG